jgi:hypothetical protein
MSVSQGRGTSLDEPLKRRSASGRFSDLGDRLARTFGGFDRTRAELPPWQDGGDLELPGDEQESWEPTGERFPIARQGYDCAAVDAHLAAVERELLELRAKAPSDSSVSVAIDRLGEQTAAILRVAHDQAQEITRRAHAEADRCLTDAAANALQMTEDASRKLRQVDAETDSVWRERERLIDDLRGVAEALVTLAEDAERRFPPESAKANPAPAAAPPAPAPGSVAAYRATAAPPAAAPRSGVAYRPTAAPPAAAPGSRAAYRPTPAPEPAVDESTMAYDPAAIAHDPAPIAHDPAAIAHDPAAIDAAPAAHTVGGQGFAQGPGS